MKATDVEIERRCGMVTGASCGHVTLSWIPGDGRNGTRSWVLATHVDFLPVLKGGEEVKISPAGITRYEAHGRS